jgi:hypothetical protein
MKKMTIILAAAGLMSLAACNNKTPEAASILNNADAVADNLSAQADNLSSEADDLTNNASAAVDSAAGKLDNAADSIRAEAKAKADNATK